MHRIVISVFPWVLLAGEALAHQGHGAPAVHFHGWEYALLAAIVAIVTIAARASLSAVAVVVAGWVRTRLDAVRASIARYR